MKKTLKVILLIPFIVAAFLFDLTKLPFVICLIMPLTFLFALKDWTEGDVYWFEDWVGFNISAATLGCSSIKYDF